MRQARSLPAVACGRFPWSAAGDVVGASARLAREQGARCGHFTCVYATACRYQVTVTAPAQRRPPAHRSFPSAMSSSVRIELMALSAACSGWAKRRDSSDSASLMSMTASCPSADLLLDLARMLSARAS